MSIGRENLGSLLGRLVSEMAAIREEAAETVTDWANSFDSFERTAVIRQLALTALVEEVQSAREAELHAIAEISFPGGITAGDVEPVFRIPASDLDPSEREYVQGLREDLAGVDVTPVADED